jgi:hypothetical protein
VSTPRDSALEIVDLAPSVDVQESEYRRLLGYPADAVLSERAQELSAWARRWYADRGRPWLYVRAMEAAVRPGEVTLDGVAFRSARLSSALQDAEADRAIVAAVGAGPELEAEAQALWRDEKPDEYFFLEIFGSAVVEHLITSAGARLCAWADERGRGILPHYSPGYPSCDIREQQPLLDLVRRTGRWPGGLSALDSGMLQPKKSLLAVFGVTSRVERVGRLAELVPCANCSYPACAFRRVPYSRSPQSSDPEVAAIAARSVAARGPGLDAGARYSTSLKALQRWRDERLSLEPRADGTLDARFRYDGTTCTNMGRPLQFEYQVRLGPAADGYRIQDQRCAPVAGDEGHRSMCRYLSDGEPLVAAIAGEQPLAGRPLNDVIGWQRPAFPAGCYCQPEGRLHKWGLVLETIHYALARQAAAATLENPS